jgi:hypothetical protein
VLVVCANHGARLIARQTSRSRRASEHSSLFSSLAAVPERRTFPAWSALPGSRLEGRVTAGNRVGSEETSGSLWARRGAAAMDEARAARAGSPRSQSRGQELRAAAPARHRAGPSGECDVQPRSSPRPRQEGDAAARRKRSVTSARRVVHVARRAEHSGSSGFTGPPFPYSRSLTIDAVLPAQRSEHAEHVCPVARQGFPGCQLDKPTWRYLTSRRRVSCICRFPLGFLSMFFPWRGRPDPRAAGASGRRRGLSTSTSRGVVRQLPPAIHTRNSCRSGGGVVLSSGKYFHSWASQPSSVSLASMRGLGGEWSAAS